MQNIMQWWATHPNEAALIVLGSFVFAALLVEFLVRRIVHRLVRSSQSELDDEILRYLRRPVFVSLTFAGVHYALALWTLRYSGFVVLDVVLITGAVMVWADALLNVAAALSARTKTDLDDELVRWLRRPVAITVLVVGSHHALTHLLLAPTTTRIIKALLITGAALVWSNAVLKIVQGLTQRTKTGLDDEIVARIRMPLAVSVIFIGVRVIAATLELTSSVVFVLEGILITVAVILWARGAIRLGRSILAALGRRPGEQRLVQPRTLPLFDISFQIITVAGAAYGILLAWHIDVTAWLASAGIAGIAVGFAAKDTLANLFSGIFIIADAPFKVGDYIVLDTGERGKVTDIGIRSTRILTRDDIEITIPNAQLGNSKIINETGGPHELERIRVNIGVAYGSDIDLVRKVLLEIAEQAENVAACPAPVVRFREFGDSSLNFQLMGWVLEPSLRGRAIDELNTAIYKRFKAEGIEIPFPQRDLWIKGQPASLPKLP